MSLCHVEREGRYRSRVSFKFNWGGLIFWALADFLCWFVGVFWCVNEPCEWQTKLSDRS